MTAYPAWTPASRPGIIPLHPLSFGTILGRAFAGLRQNPRVLLGFALVVQVLAYVLVLGLSSLIGFATYSRLQNVESGTDAYAQIQAGSFAITLVSGVALGLAASALGVVVQAVVVTEIAHAAVAERLRLGQIWRRVRPVIWRLIGYSLLLSGAFVAGATVLVLAVIALGSAVLVAGIILGVFAVLGGIAVVLWLGTKLLLVPSAIILERATIREGIARSWRLTRGRFWSTLGILVVVQVIFGVLANILSVPFSILGALLGGVVAPTGNGDGVSVLSIVVSLVIPQIVALLVQSVGLVVQSTAACIVYLDCRMRHEGLDLDLLAYVERRDAGEANLPDPFLEGVGRTFQRPYVYPVPQYAGTPYPAPGSPAPQPYPGQPYPAQPPYAAQPYAPQPPYAAQPYAPQPAPASDAAPPSETPAPSTSATEWTAPGAEPDREAP